MKKSRYNKQIKDSFYDDIFSYMNLESTDCEALYESEIEMDHFLEDYHIDDLDLSDLVDAYIDDISLI
ncbi:MAG: hypothetical protein IIA49_14885 [Bacteroidetes bacterium]|nr:hypothetical protein [Bacteroidota bacterium]MCH7772276.1 hypothetical protein [Bacteroidota bacterium]